MTIEEIIKNYLEKNGFDELCNSDAECGCNINDLFPCDENCFDCEPGYRIVDESGEYDFLITTQKPKQ